MSQIAPPVANVPLDFPWPAVKAKTGADLANQLRTLIRDRRLEPGRVLPAEREMASRLLISRSTVRRALKHLEDAGLLNCRQGSGYRVAEEDASAGVPQGLASRTVALISWAETLNPEVRRQDGLEAHVQLAATDALRAAGLHVLTIHPNTLLQDGVADLVATRPAAVFVTSVTVDRVGDKLLPPLNEAGIPVVTNNSSDVAKRCALVTHDHVAGAMALTRLMIERGNSRILPVFAGSSDVAWKQQRMSGYRSAMEAAGLPCLDPLFVPGLDERAVSIDPESASRLCLGFLYDRVGENASQAFDGILAGTDLVAQHVAHACLRLGVGLNDLPDIVGYDHTYGLSPVPKVLSGWAPTATVDKQNHLIGVGVGELVADIVASTNRGETYDSGAFCRSVEPRIVCPVQPISSASRVEANPSHVLGEM